jgi:hypothetical protein
VPPPTVGRSLTVLSDLSLEAPQLVIKPTIKVAKAIVFIGLSLLRRFIMVLRLPIVVEVDDGLRMPIC